MRAHQIMSRQVITVGVDASVADAIAIMLGHHVSGLPVVDAAGRMAGIVSEGDFIRRAEIGTARKRGRWLTLLAGADRVALDFARSHGRKVGEIMTRNPVTIGEDTPLADIVEIMEAHHVKRLPVMRGDGEGFGNLAVAPLGDPVHDAGQQAGALRWQGLDAGCLCHTHQTRRPPKV